jgi:hypothetical protein
MRHLVVIALVAVGLAGCVTPSIPIPPPDPGLMTFAVTSNPDGSITSASLHYPPTDIYKGGLVYVFNRSLGRGIIETVNTDGSIGPTQPIDASSGHALVITVENDDQTVSTCITLLDGGAVGNYCP